MCINTLASLLQMASPAPSKLDLAEEYLDLVDLHPAPLSCVAFHLRRIAREQLTQVQYINICVCIYVLYIYVFMY